MKTDGDEMGRHQRVVGQTKTAGFQIGIRRTFPLSVHDAWEFLLSEHGLSIWLGEPLPLHVTEGTTYTAKDGVIGTIRVVNPEVNIRLTWVSKAWPKASTLQVRTIPSGEQTVVSFHHEGLPGAKEREHMRRHWQSILECLQTLLQST